MDERLHELSVGECHRLLAGEQIGRVAVEHDGALFVVPVNFFVSGDSVVFRTGPGTKLDCAAAGQAAAFQVDHHTALDHSGWSVLVTGRLEELSDPVAAGLAHLPLLPWAGGDRSHLIRLSMATISGRWVGRHPGDR